MTEEIRPTPEQQFSDRLEQQKFQADKDFHTRMDQTVRKMSEHAANLRGKFEAVYAAKADSLMARVKELQPKVLEHLDGATELAMHHLEGCMKVALASLRERAILALEIAGNNSQDRDVSTPEELLRAKSSLKMFESVSAESLLQEAILQNQVLKDAGIAASFLDASQNTLLDRDLLDRVRRDEPLEEPDFEAIASQVRVTLEGKQNPEMMGQVSALLGLMSLEERESVLKRVGPSPKGMTLCVEMAKQGQLTKEQVYRLYPEQKGALTELLESDGFVRALEQGRTTRAEAVRQIQDRYQHGHKNHVRDLLTFKGIGSSIAVIWGFIVAAANTLINPWDPLDPGKWIGLGAMGLGLEGSNNLGGVGPGKPSEWFQYLTRPRQELTSERQRRLIRVTEEDMRIHQTYAEAYRDNAEVIFKAYTKRREDPKRTEREIKLTEADLAAEGFDVAAFKGNNPGTDFNWALDHFTEWAGLFFERSAGLHLHQSRDQVAFIDTALTKPKPAK